MRLPCNASRPCRPWANVSIARRTGEIASVTRHCSWRIDGATATTHASGCCQGHAVNSLDLQLYHPTELPKYTTACCGPELGAQDTCHPLSRAALQRSFVLDGDARFRRFVDRVARGVQVKVVTVGASVAHGAGSKGRGWSGHPDGPSSVRFVEFLRKRYPPGKHISFQCLY